MTTAVGSGIWSKQKAERPHLVQQGGGLAGEIADVRADLSGVLAPLAAIAVVEYTNPVAAAPAGLEAATATTVAPRTVTSFLAGGVAALLADGRNITFTTAGVTPADAPATALITGTDMDGKVQTETVNLAQTATIANGVKAFKTVTKVEYAAADGTAATVSIGFGLKLGVPRTPKVRAGLAAILREIAVGAIVTTGALDAPNRTYLPSTAPDGSNDYCIYFEHDASLVADQ